MSSDDAIISEIRAALPPAYSSLPVTEQTHIARDLGLDSLAIMNFVMAIEDRLDISIPIDRMAEIETMGDLARTVRELQSRQG